MPKLNRPSSSRLLVGAVCASLAAAMACGGDTTGPGPSLVFITQPGGAIAGEPIDPAVEVMVRSASGRPLGGTVTLTLENNPCGFQFSGALTVEVSDTTAVFADLKVGQVGKGFALRASYKGASAVSEPFDVRSGVVTELLTLENAVCLEVEFHGDGESLTYVPEDNSFLIADDNQELIYEVDPKTGRHGSEIVLGTILEALPDAGQCDDGDGNPVTVCSYVDNFELLEYDPATRLLYVVNTVDSPSDRPAIFKLSKGACAGCFTPESWQPLPVGPSYRSIIVADGQMYLALTASIYPYDYDTNQLANVDATGNPVPPDYMTSSSVAGLSFDGTYMWILTRSRVLYQVEWATRTEHQMFDLDAFGFSLPRGTEVVRDTIYIVEGDVPNLVYVLTQRQL